MEQVHNKIIISILTINQELLY